MADDPRADDGQASREDADSPGDAEPASGDVPLAPADDPVSAGDGAPSPVDTARDLRWRAVRDIVLDPIAILGTAVVAWALVRTGVAGTLTGLLALTAIATRTADDLLFRRPDGDLLRVHPLGDEGFGAVRQAELGWWMHPVRILAAACAWSAAGPWVAALTWYVGAMAPRLGMRLALAGRRVLGARFGVWIWIPAAVSLAADVFGAGAVPGTGASAAAAADGVGAGSGFGGAAWSAWAVPLAFWGLAAVSGVGLRRAFVEQFPQLASDAATAPRARGRRAWQVLYAGTLPFVWESHRVRLVRDALLTFRGQDPQGLILLTLAPLSCLVLVGELEALPSAAALTWRTLTCAALGGAAVAYAVGPGLHRLRIGTMAWERTAPSPGAGALTSALWWGMGLALLHGCATLATVMFAHDQRYLHEASALALPVLGLEAAMAHHVVTQTFATQSGRRILGEGTLVLSLPVVAVVVALAGLFVPPLVLAYFVITAGLTAAAAKRYEAVEVTW